jgi:Mn2+/Fe2+ NRAMP family transporter
MFYRPLNQLAAMFFAAICFLFLFLVVLSPAQAADEPIVSPSSIWFDVWQIVQPIVVLLVTTVGPVLVAAISARVLSVLKVTDENKKLAIDQQLRDALHQSATNALKYALAKARITAPVTGLVTASMIADAATYVEEKNPEALAKLNVGGNALRDIIMSKVPDILGPNAKVSP